MFSSFVPQLPGFSRSFRNARLPQGFQLQGVQPMINSVRPGKQFAVRAALGNLAVQMIAAGEFEDLRAARACIADSFAMEKFEGEKGETR